MATSQLPVDAHRPLETKSASPKLIDMLPGLERALDRLDVTKLKGWSEISRAYPRAVFDGMTIYMSALVQLDDGKGFAAPADIALRISGQGAEEFEESCPARVLFKVAEGQVKITDIDADLNLSSEAAT